MQGAGADGAAGRTDRVESRTVQQLEVAVKEQQQYMQQQTDAIRGLQNHVQSAESRQRNPRVLDQGKLDVPLFYAKLGEDFREFLDMFEVIAQALGWDDAQRLRLMPAYLRGTALATFKALGAADKDSYAKLKDALKSLFQPAESARLFRLELHNRRQGKTESVGDYANDVLRLVRAAYPEAGTFQNHLKLEFFTAGLKPELQRAAAGFDSSSFEKAVALTKKFEAQDLLLGEARFGKMENCAADQDHDHQEVARNYDPNSDIRMAVRELMDSVQQMRIQNAVIAAEQEARVRMGRTSDRLNVLREHFGAPSGHVTDTRPRKWDNAPRRPVPIQGRPVVCFKCGKRGHIRKDCRSTQQSHNGQWRAPQAGTGASGVPNLVNHGRQQYTYHVAASCETPNALADVPQSSECLELRKLALEEKRLALEEARLHYQMGNAGGQSPEYCNFTGLRTIFTSEHEETFAFRKPGNLVCAATPVEKSDTVQRNERESAPNSDLGIVGTTGRDSTRTGISAGIQHFIWNEAYDPGLTFTNITTEQPLDLSQKSVVVQSPTQEEAAIAATVRVAPVKMECFATTGYPSAQIKMHKQVPCDICGKHYTKSSLKQHKSRMHLREKPHKCRFCGNKFATVREQHLHEIVHTNVKPFTCGICSRAFKRKDHLMMHVTGRHGLYRSDSVACTYCGKRYVTTTGLCKHITQKHVGSITEAHGLSCDSELRHHEESDTDSMISVGREAPLVQVSSALTRSSSWPQLLATPVLLMLMLFMCSLRLGVATEPMICQARHSRMVFQLPESYNCNVTIHTNSSEMPRNQSVHLYRQNLLQYHTEAWKCTKILHKISAFTYFFNDENLKLETRVQVAVSQAECQRMREFQECQEGPLEPKGDLRRTNNKITWDYPGGGINWL